MSERNELTKEDFTQLTAVIRLTHCYHTGIETERIALYEATRAYWSIEKNRSITQAKLALAVHNGIVLEVYTIAAWLPANSTLMAQRLDRCADKKDGNLLVLSQTTRCVKNIWENLFAAFSSEVIRFRSCVSVPEAEIDNHNSSKTENPMGNIVKFAIEPLAYRGRSLQISKTETELLPEDGGSTRQPSSISDHQGTFRDENA